MRSALDSPSWPYPEVELAPCPQAERYLAELALYLQGIVPDEEIRRLLEESADHLAAILEERVCGDDVDEVLAEFGEPRRLADACIEAWYNGRSDKRLFERWLGPANMIVLALFGAAALSYWVLLQVRVFLPSGAAFHLPWSPAQLRRYFPEPLPFPDFSWSFLLTTGIPILAPPILGWIVGKLVPVRPHAAVYSVLVLLTVFGYVLGILLLPVMDGLVFAVFQTVYWLPVGCGAAHLSSCATRKKRARMVARMLEAHR